MNYSKPALTYGQQADLLIRRGLIVTDKSLLEARLRSVSYYRLSAYWHPFRLNDDRFQAGTNWEMIWRRYVFDRHLRLLVMDAIERVEVAVLRTWMVEEFALQYGPFGYLNPSNFRPEFPGNQHARLVQDVDDGFGNSREVFAEHYRQKYHEEQHPPLWMAAEVMTFGQLFTFYRNLHRPLKQRMASALGVLAPVLDSWLFTLNYVRNVCAHHGRLWNRELPIRPLIPDRKHNAAWHMPTTPDNRRVYAVLSLLRQSLKIIAPQSQWSLRFRELVARYPDVPLVSMGFPADWEKSPIWAATETNSKP